MQKFKFVGKPLLGEKYVEGKRIMPSLVATTSTPARKPLCARTTFAPKYKVYVDCKLAYQLSMTKIVLIVV